MENIVLITREACSYCDNAKRLLKNENKNWKEKLIGEDITRDDVIKSWPKNKVLPIVLLNDKLIGESGTYNDLLDYLYPPLNLGNKAPN